jgi:hypothetical protein
VCEPALFPGPATARSPKAFRTGGRAAFLAVLIRLIVIIARRHIAVVAAVCVVGPSGPVAGRSLMLLCVVQSLLSRIR